MKTKTIIIIISLCLIAISLTSQETLSVETKQANEQTLSDYVLPLALVTYGVLGLESHFLRFYNYEIKEEVGEHIDRKLSIDDFAQYSPFTTVYLLNSFGLVGEHNFVDRSIILGSAYLMMGASVLTLKSLTNVTRPDGSANNSFPSGHTATAFMGAEFLYQEYKDVSKWYGLLAYTVAIGTGAFRIANDRHWLTDVSAGAGIGMLSTKLSYYFFHKYKDNKKLQNLTFSPSFIDNSLYLSLSYRFK